MTQPTAPVGLVLALTLGAFAAAVANLLGAWQLVRLLA